MRLHCEHSIFTAKGQEMTYTIIGMAIPVFALRYLPIGLAGRYRMPEVIERALIFAPPVALSGIVVTTVVGMLEKGSTPHHITAVF